MAARYDIFLSHSSADKLAVEELAHKDGRIVVAGDQAGRVHFLDLMLPE